MGTAADSRGLDRSAVLVIEDDADARENLRDILELEDYTVEVAGTAEEALGRDDWSRYDAIILDRQLPDANADLVLPILRRNAPQAAVIVVTGHADLQGAIEALREGAVDYILKPLSIEALTASLIRVTQRRRLALAKERSEAAFRNLVEAAECLILIVDHDLRVAYISPFAEELTGYRSADATGRRVSELFPASDGRTPLDQELARAFDAGPIQGVEYPIDCRHGHICWTVWNARPLTDPEGRTSILAVGQDITKVKQAQERAVQAERLAAIGQMVAGLAHESRNALQRAQACIEMLALAVQDRPDALDLIKRLQTAQDHLHFLYEDVQGYAAPIALKRADCALSEVWRDAWSQLEPMRKGRRVELIDSAAVESARRACVDRFRLAQVFRNILENSLAACDDPARIEITTDDDSINGCDAVRIVVRDDGPGLTDDQRDRVFDPFYTTKARGTGLGLAIARRIVEAHSGRIVAEKSTRPGAVFSIILPKGNT